MATKTMILRPLIVDSPDETLISFIPPITNTASAYALINEVIADDDAGYIICSAGGEVNSYFNYVRPADMINITGISVKIRCMLESSQTNKALKNSFMVSSSFSATNLTVTTEYADYELVFSDIDTMISELNSVTEANLSLVSSVTSGTKNSPIRITQIFVEITYDCVSVEIYHKTDGVWKILSEPQYYKFSGGAWQSCTNNEFYDGQKYILQSN